MESSNSYSCEINASIPNIISIPKKNNKEPGSKPIEIILCCNSSINATKIITPAENPIIKERNFGFGPFIKKATKLPIVVDKPAIMLNNRAKKYISNPFITKMANSIDTAPFLERVSTKCFKKFRRS